MSDTLRLLAVELVLLLGLGTAAWLVGLWRARRRRTAELESLLDALEKAAPARCERYCQWLKAHCGVDEERALLTADAWLAAERRFWRHFVAWRLEPGASAPDRLPEQLHRCLDDRLEALGPLLRPEEAAVETEPVSGDEAPQTPTDEAPSPQPAETETSEVDAPEPETGSDTGDGEAEEAAPSPEEDEAENDSDAGDGEADEEPPSPQEDEDDEVVILSDRRSEDEVTDSGEAARDPEPGAQSPEAPQ